MLPEMDLGGHIARRGPSAAPRPKQRVRERRRVAVHVVAAALVMALLPSCRDVDVPRSGPPAGDSDLAQVGALTVDYPLDETVFPPGIAPPRFRWTDTDAGTDVWRITVTFTGDTEPLSFDVHRAEWTPDAPIWEAIQRRSLENAAEVAIRGVHALAPDAVLSRASITIRTSKDEVGAPIFYREVNLPFSEAVKDPTNIRWRFGAISSQQQPPIVLEKLPVCGNCHSFSADGGLLGMDVDYANDKGSYALASVADEMVLSKDKIITWSDYRRDDGEHTFGLLSQVSPDGRYVVSTVKDRSVFVPKPDLTFSQLFFPIKGILAVYSREAGTFEALPGADNPRFVQSNPTWSPDGKYIVFARSDVYYLKTIRDKGSVLLAPDECEGFLKGGNTFQFDLYRIPFNDGKGGKPEPIEGASNNGMSNFFARYSPDGKWIVFCKARSFMLLQPDSELYIIPATGGKARRLRCNTPRMNSWHSWSPNSRWLVFSSKANTPYTQLFLSHIDAEGHSSPPVLLAHFTAPDRAANIPEFVAVGPTAIKTIREQFIDDVSHVRAGEAFMRADDIDAAITEYRRALELNPVNAIAHCNLGGLLSRKGMVEEGAEHLTEALRLDPDSSSAHYNLGMLLYRQRRIDEAITHLSAAVRIKPDLSDAHSMLGSLLCAKGMFREGAMHFSEALRHDPHNAASHYGLGELLARQGRLEEAVRHLSLAVQIEPDYASAHYSLGKVMFSLNRIDESIRHLSLAVQYAPDDSEMLRDFAWILVTAPDPSRRDGARAVQLAKRSCELTKYRQVEPLDVLGVCYAETGQFAEAVRSAEKALQLAIASGNQLVTERIRERIALYKRGMPYQAPGAP
ncbi:MAG: tetratricopeptide repeat protein [Phycisphaerae bacterium]|nr:tetratricopeptide repeat protein [Phycisphaerae bacterium]